MTPIWWDFVRDNSLNAASRTLILEYRVNPCRHGSCKSDECFGYHNRSQRRRRPFVRGQLVYEDSICPSRPNCPNGDTCNLCHSRFEMAYHPYRYKTRPCFNLANCTAGKLCCYAHGNMDLRVCGMPRTIEIAQWLPPANANWSDSDRLFFIICWLQLVDSQSLDLDKVEWLHHNLLCLHPADSLIRDGAACHLENILRRARNSRSQTSTASSTLD